MPYRRFRHDFDLRDTGRTLSVACTDAVASRVAATDDQHVFAFGVYAFFLAECLSAQDAVLLGQRFQCEVYAFEVAPRDIEVACLWGSRADAVSVEAFRQVFHVDGSARLEGDAFGFHDFRPAVDDGLVEFEVRDAETQQPAHIFVLFKYRHFISHAVQLVGCGHACGT